MTAIHTKTHGFNVFSSPIYILQHIRAFGTIFNRFLKIGQFSGNMRFGRCDVPKISITWTKIIFFQSFFFRLEYLPRPLI